MTEREVEALKLQFCVKPCDCSAMKGPHYHAGDHTLIPWDEFVKSMKGLQEASVGAVINMSSIRVVKCKGSKVC